MSGILPTPANRAAVWGRAGVYEIKQALINASQSGDNTIVSAVAGRKIRVLAIKYRAAGSVTATWKSGTGGTATAISAPDSLKEGYGISDAWGPWCYFFETLAGEALNLYLDGAVQVSGEINYILIDP